MAVIVRRRRTTDVAVGEANGPMSILKVRRCALSAALVAIYLYVMCVLNPSTCYALIPH